MSSKKTAIVFAAAVIIVVIALYFILGSSKLMMNTARPITAPKLDLFRNMQIKTVYNDDGTIDMFVLAPSSNLSAYRAKGMAVPMQGTIVLGSEQGLMMKEEGEYKRIGDNIEEQGTVFKVSGVLEATGTFADDFHYLSSEDYANLSGGFAGVSVVKLKDGKVPKLFYLYNVQDKNKINLTLAEGNFTLFTKQFQGDATYYPLILGYDEAKMMREEKLFNKVGDTLDGFFGRNIVIVGVLEKTNTSLDMAHVVESNFFNTEVKA